MQNKDPGNSLENQTTLSDKKCIKEIRGIQVIQSCTLCNEGIKPPQVSEEKSDMQIKKGSESPQVSKENVDMQIKKGFESPQGPKEISTVQIQKRFQSPQVPTETVNIQIKKSLESPQVPKDTVNIQIKKSLESPQVPKKISNVQIPERFQPPQVPKGIPPNLIQGFRPPQVPKGIPPSLIQEELKPPQVPESYTQTRLKPKLPEKSKLKQQIESSKERIQTIMCSNNKSLPKKSLEDLKLETERYRKDLKGMNRLNKLLVAELDKNVHIIKQLRKENENLKKSIQSQQKQKIDPPISSSTSAYKNADMTTVASTSASSSYETTEITYTVLSAVPSSLPLVPSSDKNIIGIVPSAHLSTSSHERIVDYFSPLSDKLLVKIFTHIPKYDLVKHCTLVCKRWNKLCFNSELWKNADVKMVKRNINLAIIRKFILCGIYSLDLSFSQISCKSPAIVDLSFSEQEEVRLKKLCMINVKGETETIETILSWCTQLKELCIEKQAMTDNICRYITENINLKELDLADTVGIKPSHVMNICSRCIKLQALYLDFTFLNEEALTTLSQMIPLPVKTLWLCGTEELNEIHISGIIDRCPHIFSLGLFQCAGVTPSVLDLIISQLHDIQDISLSITKELTIEELEPLRRCSHLEEINLRSDLFVNKECLKHLKRSFRPSVTISLWNGTEFETI